jgi:heme-degrading monooxygenase HmoA
MTDREVDKSEFFRVIIRLDINEGMEADFEKTWLSIGSIITDHPANIGQWLMKSSTETAVYYVTSDWLDEPQFREFELGAAHVEHRTKLHPFRHGGAMYTMSGVYSLIGAAHSTAGAR